MKNPLDVRAESADVDAGHEVYTKKCEICHAYDDGGKTEIGSGQYPRPPDLRRADVQRMSDGCHGPNTQNGPHAPTLEAHTHHAPGSAGSQCVACHMPKIEQTIANVSVRAHTFKFITPAETDASKDHGPSRTAGGRGSRCAEKLKRQCRDRTI